METCIVCEEEDKIWTMRYVIVNVEVKIGAAILNRTVEGWAHKRHGNKEVRHVATQIASGGRIVGTLGKRNALGTPVPLVDTGEPEEGAD